jgi:hypothetical protein
VTAKKTTDEFFLSALVVLVLSLVLVSGPACRKPAVPGSPAASRPLAVDIQVDKVRPQPGETIAVSVAVGSLKPLRGVKVSGSVFIPTRGAVALELQPAGDAGEMEARYQGSLSLDRESAEGLYALTVEAVRGREKAYGKASFLLGKVVADFMPVSALPDEGLEQDLETYYEDFRKTGGNLVIIHNFITDKALYPSRICSKAAAPGSPDDKVTVALRLAERFGLTSLLTAGWDMTRPMPYAECLASTKEVIADLWEIYGSNPALLGFYSYQEGSGTYLAAQMREFAGAVKAQNRGLLTACSPYIDDPLLAGYLSAIDDLDIVIYQGAVMASYRPDNRKCFPPRRTKDFTGLSAGATRARRKITISHVELFGYLEKQVAGVYLASPQDIRAQILSAATAFGPDGISFFNYYYCIHLLGKKVPEVQGSREAVIDAMAGYSLIARSAAAASSRIAVYIPYTDWWSDRWTNTIVPALDACRRLGISPDILPFVPPPGEEILPYYPLHLNPEQLAFFQANNYVIVLTDIGGLQDTDSFLIRKFIEDGGVVVFFGPRIPYTRAYARDEVCGGGENASGMHTGIRVLQPLQARVRAGQQFRFEALESPSWTAAGGTAVAVFEDGQSAVLASTFGKGRCYTIPLTLAEAVRVMPEVVRGVLDEALARGGGNADLPAGSRTFDVLGLSEDSDIAMAAPSGRRVVAVVNYKNKPVDIDLLPLGLEPAAGYALTDLRSGAVVRAGLGKDLAHTTIAVPAVDFICLSLAQKN